MRLISSCDNLDAADEVTLVFVDFELFDVVVDDLCSCVGLSTFAVVFGVDLTVLDECVLECAFVADDVVGLEAEDVAFGDGGFWLPPFSFDEAAYVGLLESENASSATMSVLVRRMGDSSA